LQRHLTAFKTDLYAATGTCLLTFVAFTGSFSLAAAMTSADSLTLVGGTLCGRKLLQFHDIRTSLLDLFTP
jgi:hypothetical protein